METILALLLRKGAIPVCCTGATFCFGLYSAKLSHAADLWKNEALVMEEEQPTNGMANPYETATNETNNDDRSNANRKDVNRSVSACLLLQLGSTWPKRYLSAWSDAYDDTTTESGCLDFYIM